MKALTPKAAIGRLRAAIKASGSQVKFAAEHSLDRSYLNNVLNGERPLTDRIAKTIGLKRTMVFVPTEPDPRGVAIRQAQHDDEERFQETTSEQPQ